MKKIIIVLFLFLNFTYSYPGWFFAKKEQDVAKEMFNHLEKHDLYSLKQITDEYINNVKEKCDELGLDYLLTLGWCQVLVTSQIEYYERNKNRGLTEDRMDAYGAMLFSAALFRCAYLMYNDVGIEDQKLSRIARKIYEKNIPSYIACLIGGYCAIEAVKKFFDVKYAPVYYLRHCFIQKRLDDKISEVQIATGKVLVGTYYFIRPNRFENI